jgi:chorismate mutase
LNPTPVPTLPVFLSFFAYAGTGRSTEDDMTLEETRDMIDVLDRQLVELLSARARAVLQIGRLKAASALPIYEPVREKLIYANVRAVNKGPLPDIELTRIFERLIDVMRSLEMHESDIEKNAQADAPGQCTGGRTPETGK